jgi:excisionase family DNA binding protein
MTTKRNPRKRACYQAGVGLPATSTLHVVTNRQVMPPSLPGPTEEPLYLAARDVAGLLKVAEKTVYALRKADPSMPALKIGGAVRFPKERLLKWLREREQGRRHQTDRHVPAPAKPLPNKATATP